MLSISQGLYPTELMQIRANFRQFVVPLMNGLSPGCRVPLDKRSFSARHETRIKFYGTRRFTIAFTEARHWSVLSQKNPGHTCPYYFLTHSEILPSTPRFSKTVSFQGFPINTLGSSNAHGCTLTKQLTRHESHVHP